MRSLLFFVSILISVQAYAENQSIQPLASPRITQSEIMAQSNTAQPELVRMLAAAKEASKNSRCNINGNSLTQYGCDIYSRKGNNSLLKEVTFRGGIDPIASKAGGFQVILTW